MATFRSRSLTKFATHATFAISAFAAVFLAASFSFADTVETKSGSKLTGKITQIDGDNVTISSNFGGDIKIKKTEIVSLTTDAPMNVRLNDGTVALGAASMSAPGTLVLATDKGSVTTSLDKVAQTWAADAKDPEVAKLERHWNFEASLDIAGKNGNTKQFGTSVAFRATLKSSIDALRLYAGYDRQETDNYDGNGTVKSADQGRLGADYQNNFSGRYSWYARDELGFDRIKAIDFYNNAAAGLGYDVVKTAKDTLTFRAGVAHRYEKYVPPGGSLSTLALDFTLINELRMGAWKMNNLIRYQPSVDDFMNTYWLYHESSLEIPLSSPRWKFRVGIANDYRTPVPVGAANRKRLDTTYFARLVLTW